MFDSWPADCRIIAESLRPLLCRHKADFYPVGVNKQVRVGWYLPTRKSNPWVAHLEWVRYNCVNLTLRVSPDSGFIDSNGPLKRSTDYGKTNSDSNKGSIHLSTTLPEELPLWIDNAFNNCVKLYGKKYHVQLEDDSLITSISELESNDPDAKVNTYNTSPTAVDLESPIDRVSVTFVADCT